MLLANWRPWRRLGDKHKSTKPIDPKILKLATELEVWRDGRVFVGVSVPHDDRAYQSMVLAVNAARGLFLLDGLFPLGAGSQYLLHQVLGLEARMSNARTYLSARCINFGPEPDDNQSGGRTLVMQIPDSASQSPRRAAFRVNLTDVKDAEVNWLAPQCSGEMPSFSIENVSSTGLAVRVPTHFAERIRMLGEGAVLVSVLDTMFEAMVQVRHLRLISESHAVVGLEFTRLTTDKIIKLEGWVARLQRQVLHQAGGRGVV